MGKITIGYAAWVVWDNIPLNVKELNVYQFSKQLNPYLLSEQQIQSTVHIHIVIQSYNDRRRHNRHEKRNRCAMPDTKKH